MSKKSILLKQRPLQERYLEMDYPEDSEDEWRATKQKFQEIERGAMDVLDQLDAIDSDDEIVVQKSAPPPPKKSPVAKKKKRFTQAWGYLQYVMAVVHKVGCADNAEYASPPDPVHDSAALLAEKERIVTARSGATRFLEWLHTHKQALNEHMLQCGNDDLCEFYRVLQTHQYLTEERVAPTENNVWSGLAIDADTRITVYPSQTNQEDAHHVDVNAKQALILRVCHHVNHLPGYVLDFLSDVFPEGTSHNFTQLWEQQLMTNYGKKDDFKWSNANCNELEACILNLYTSIAISIEWLKKK